MAILTDATLPDFSPLATEQSAEVRSITSGSGGDGMEAISQQARKLDAHNLETGMGSSADVPFAITKESARKIAELTSEDEYNSLVSQRRTLAHKQLDGILTRDEVLQLRLIEWTINCVEKSRAGLNLDSLQQLADLHEGIAARVTHTVQQLQSVVDAEIAKNREASRRTFRRTA